MTASHVAAEINKDHGKHIIQTPAASAAVTAPIPAQATFVHEYLTTDETARYLRCESQTIRKSLSLKGTFWGLKPRRFGRRWYFKATEVRAMLEAA
ncbi:helix-turn-helix domain-containing protein [Paraburkholderia sp. GAS32]|uniref:helix-turn-helix domain-containing protein n=1 Tax=Paraburkholderia sp. GAS32 TaxID=3035129 RepID=UPI003D1B015A